MSGNLNASIVGKVIDAISGDPVQHASVTITSGPAPVPDIAIMTSEEGVFTVYDLAAGTWVLSALDQCQRSGNARCDTSPEHIATCTIRVPGLPAP